MASSWLITDISTAPIVGAVEHLKPIKAPKNYKDPAKIAAYIEEETQKRADGIFDIDLLRITGIGLGMADQSGQGGEDSYQCMECRNEDDERAALTELAKMRFRDGLQRTWVGFNALAFDWPVLRRRARHLGVKFPHITVSPAWRSTDLDLFAVLKDEGGAQSLGFYVKLLEWTDLQKPLSGAEESRVHETGAWDKLRASLYHDVAATARLGRWMGVL